MRIVRATLMATGVRRIPRVIVTTISIPSPDAISGCEEAPRCT